MRSEETQGFQQREAQTGQVIMTGENADMQEVYPRVYMSGFHVPTYNTELMKQTGITHVLSIIGVEPDNLKGSFTCLWFGDIQDNDSQDLTSKLQEGVDFIDSALANPNHKVLVHCAAGISRSGAFCVAYMIFKEPTWSV